MIQVTPTIWTRMADSSSDVEPTNWSWRLECPCDQLPYLRGFWTCRPIRWDPFPSSPKVIKFSSRFQCSSSFQMSYQRLNQFNKELSGLNDFDEPGAEVILNFARKKMNVCTITDHGMALYPWFCDVITEARGLFVFLPQPSNPWGCSVDLILGRPQHLLAWSLSARWYARFFVRHPRNKYAEDIVTLTVPVTLIVRLVG